VVVELGRAEILLSELQYLALQKVNENLASKKEMTQMSLIADLAQELNLDSKVAAILVDPLFGKSKTGQSIGSLIKSWESGRISGIVNLKPSTKMVDHFISGLTDYALDFYNQAISKAKKDETLSETAIDSMLIRHVKKLKSVLISSLSEIVPDQSAVIKSLERLRDKGLIETKGNYAFYS